jgi:hypothetical protein
VKQQVLTGSENTVNKALSESFQLEAIKIAAGTFISLQQMNARTIWRSWRIPTERKRD